MPVTVRGPVGRGLGSQRPAGPSQNSWPELRPEQTSLSWCRDRTLFQLCLPQEDGATGRGLLLKGRQGVMASNCPKSHFRPYSEFHKQDSALLNSTSHLSGLGMVGYPCLRYCFQSRAWAQPLRRSGSTCQSSASHSPWQPRSKTALKPSQSGALNWERAYAAQDLCKRTRALKLSRTQESSKPQQDAAWLSTAQRKEQGRRVGRELSMHQERAHGATCSSTQPSVLQVCN